MPIHISKEVTEFFYTSKKYLMNYCFVRLVRLARQEAFEIYKPLDARVICTSINWDKIFDFENMTMHNDTAVN